MRGFQSAEATQCGIVAAISIVQSDVVISTFVMGFDLEFVEYLREASQMLLESQNDRVSCLAGHERSSEVIKCNTNLIRWPGVVVKCQTHSFRAGYG